MTAPLFDRVTDKQKECLRLVLRRNSSKEIALELGISSHTVDARLKGALKALGTASRFEAARLLAEYEVTHIRGLAYQPPNLPNQPEFGDSPEHESNAEQIEGVNWGWLFPIPTTSQPVASFTPVQKLASVLVIMVATVFIMGSLLTSYEALSSILGAGK